MDNILILSLNDKLGGAEQVLKMIALYHDKNIKIKVFFFSSQRTDSWNDLSLKLNIDFTYSNFKNPYLGVFSFINLLLNKNYYERVYSSNVFVNSLTGVLRKINLLNAKLLIGRESTNPFNRFGSFKKSIYRFIYTFGYRELDLLIFQTIQMKNDFKKKMPNLYSKINSRIIHNPISLTAQKNDFRNSFFDKNFIVTAGRLIPEKGYDNLIHAFKNFRVNQPDINLIILGDGPEKDNLHKLIINLELTGSVFLKGFVKNVYPYFEKAKICIVSSRIEGFPNVLLQMMSQNTKVISTLCAGGIKDLKGVFTVEVDDIKELSSMMTNVLKQDTHKNRVIFDILLRKRDINVFMKDISDSIKKNEQKNNY